MTVLLFLHSETRRCSLRALWRLLGFGGTVGNHVRDTLAEMASFGLGRQFALFGMMVQTAAIVTPVEKL